MYVSKCLQGGWPFTYGGSRTIYVGKRKKCVEYFVKERGKIKKTRLWLQESYLACQVTALTVHGQFSVSVFSMMSVSRECWKRMLICHGEVCCVVIYARCVIFRHKLRLDRHLMERISDILRSVLNTFCSASQNIVTLYLKPNLQVSLDLPHLVTILPTFGPKLTALIYVIPWWQGW